MKNLIIQKLNLHFEVVYSFFKVGGERTYLTILIYIHIMYTHICTYYICIHTYTRTHIYIWNMFRHLGCVLPTVLLSQAPQMLVDGL